MVPIRVLLALSFATSVAHAAPKRSYAVEVSPPSWRADALATTLRADLADDRLAFHDACCTDAELRAAGVELAVRVRIGPTLHYELRALWPGAPPPVVGEVALGAMDRTQLTGALRDRLHRFVRASVGGAELAAIELPGLPGVLGALAAIAAVLAIPFVLGARKMRRIVAFRAMRTTALVLVAAGAAAIAMILFAAPA